MPRSGDLRVWWMPQVPMEPFRFPVDSPAEAKKFIDVLADYDIFQLENNVKPDFSNAGGLEVFLDGEWGDWFDPDTGKCIDDWETE